METVTDLNFLDSKITADGDCSHKISRHFHLAREAMKILDIILKSKEVTLLQMSIQSKFWFFLWKFSKTSKCPYSQRCYFASNVHTNRSYGFSSSHAHI